MSPNPCDSHLQQRLTLASPHTWPHNLEEPYSLRPFLRRRGWVMTDFDPKLGVLVSGNDIVVVLTGSIYTVTYFKQRGSHGLLAKNIPDKDDPRIPMTAAEFLAKAWKAANQKAKELGWIPGGR
jgi:hypothetical protein